MARYRVPGGYRRKVIPSCGDTKKILDLKNGRARDADACRFPARCAPDCVECGTETDD